MEVFKYITQKHLDAIRQDDVLLPRKFDGRIYGIPDAPNLWGETTNEIINHLMKWAGVSSVILIKFMVNDEDMEAAVQDGNDYVWDKMENRHPISEYVREDYVLPEVIVAHPIPFKDITILGDVSLPISVNG